jgi:hypothetical protein
MENDDRYPPAALDPAGEMPTAEERAEWIAAVQRALTPDAPHTAAQPDIEYSESLRLKHEDWLTALSTKTKMRTKGQVAA